MIQAGCQTGLPDRNTHTFVTRTKQRSGSAPSMSMAAHAASPIPTMTEPSSPLWVDWAHIVSSLNEELISDKTACIHPASHAFLIASSVVCSSGFGLFLLHKHASNCEPPQKEPSLVGGSESSLIAYDAPIVNVSPQFAPSSP